VAGQEQERKVLLSPKEDSMSKVRPTRVVVCIALLAVMAWPLASPANAQVPSVGVTMTNPSGTVPSGLLLHATATIAGADVASTCINNPLLPCNLVSYVAFKVDGQTLARDYTAPYSLGLRYNGPNGQHKAKAQAFREIWGDSSPVLLGQDSSWFCVNSC
jgi:hypothetical protein